MLNITGLNRFFFVRDFHDMRCKYDKVLSIIHQQLNREPEDGDVFIVMSKGLRLVRLFSYDRRSYSMFERRFRPGYQFMQVTYNGAGNGKMPARVVAAAHGIGNISHALQKVNMGNIIQIYSGIKFACQLKIFGRRIVGRKHNFITLKANRISH